MLSGNEAANPTCRLHPPLRRSQPATHSHQAHHDRCLRFPLQVTEDDLEQFHASFKGGEEERAELLKYYRQFEGDMAKVRGGTGVGFEAVGCGAHVLAQPVHQQGW